MYQRENCNNEEKRKTSTSVRKYEIFEPLLCKSLVVYNNNKSS